MSLRACVSCSLKVQAYAGLAFLCLTWLAVCAQPMGGAAEVMCHASQVNCLPQPASFKDADSKLNQL